MCPATTLDSVSGRRRAPTQREKVRFLSMARNYPDAPNHVDVIETHHAWVFVTRRHAYKMKKPHRHGPIDYSSVDARRFLCEEEYRLNRRLAENTYLGVVPLSIGRDGELKLDGDGSPVEWLVKMRRLPADCMLDEAIANGTVTVYDVSCLMWKLHHFHQSAPGCRVGEGSYTARLRREIEEIGAESMQPRFEFPASLTRHVTDRLTRYVDENAEMLESRQLEGFVREVHGDLRPEHVCLLPKTDPEIIDCLEFDRNLRCLDCVEELAYFGIECRMIDAHWIERMCEAWYRSHGADSAPEHLWQFYAARRANVRAVLAARHVFDCDAGEHWLDVGRAYLSIARDCVDVACVV